MDSDGQLELVPAPKTRSSRRRKTAAKPIQADRLPIASVHVDTGLAHLDRSFDYLVPADLDELVVPGSRVRVRFAGTLVDGFVIDRTETSQFEGSLSFITKAVSAESVVSPEVYRLARAVADRYAGTVCDVLRLAVPPRHVAAERQKSEAVTYDRDPDARVLAMYPTGPDLIQALSDGASPRVALSVLAGNDPALAAAHAALATARGDRGSIVCVPDGRDVAAWQQRFAEVLGDGFVVLTGAQSAADRYRAFLAVRRGAVRVVLGTRAAAFAPMPHLGLLVLFDDGDDLYSDPRAPYPHTREVMLLRANQSRCALIFASYARSTETQALVESGWCGELVASQQQRRENWPRVDITDGTDTAGVPVRLPRQVFGQIRAATDPVLVQVPRRGYRAALACQQCRQPARCATCEGPLGQEAADADPICRWCGLAVAAWSCLHCRGTELRAPVVGQLRTAEEMSRAFADYQVVTSGGDSVLTEAPPGRTMVLATPGAEPPVAGGYGLVVLLDTWLMTARDDVRVIEEAYRRWFNALALAAPGSRAIAVGDTTVLQGLVRADPVDVARTELADRYVTHMPPAGRLASVEGHRDDLQSLAQRTWTAHTDVLGPAPSDPRRPELARLVLRTPRREGAELSALLSTVLAERSANKQPSVRVQVDPLRF